MERFRHLEWFVSLLFLILFGRLAYLQLFQQETFQKRVEARRLKAYFQPPRRGEIRDTHGNVLAKDQPGFVLAAEPRRFDPRLAFAYAFSPTKKHLEKLYPERQSPFLFATCSPRRASRFWRRFRKLPQAEQLVTLQTREDEGEPVVEVWLQPRLFQLTSHHFEQIAQRLHLPLEPLRQRWQKFWQKLLATDNMYERKVLLRTPFELTSLNDQQVLWAELLRIDGLTVQAKRLRQYFHRDLVGHLIGRCGLLNRREYLELRRQGKILNFVQHKIHSLEEGRPFLDGYFLNERIGRSGVERAFEEELKGRKGLAIYELHIRQKKRVLKASLPPQGGKNIHLTIHLPLHRVLHKAFQRLDRAIQRGRWKSATGRASGAAVAIHPETGEVFALFSYPPLSEKEKKLLPFFFRPLQGAYPPGSIFKPISALAFLETPALNITPQSQIFCARKLKGSRFFKCLGYHGPTDVVRALKKSCNIYFYVLGEKLGGDGLAQWAKNFGLAETTGLEFLRERRALVPSPQWKRRRFPKQPQWWPGDSRNFAIGQGFLTVTPVGICRAIAAIFNGGKVLRLHLRPHSAEVVRSLKLSPRHVKAIFYGMREVVRPGGTAYGSGLERFSVAAKTGSAQDGRGWNYAWIAGVAWGRKGAKAYPRPPRIAFVVLVERTSGHGGDAAAPIAAELLEVFFQNH